MRCILRALNALKCICAGFGEGRKGRQRGREEGKGKDKGKGENAREGRGRKSQPPLRSKNSGYEPKWPMKFCTDFEQPAYWLGLKIGLLLPGN